MMSVFAEIAEVYSIAGIIRGIIHRIIILKTTSGINKRIRTVKTTIRISTIYYLFPAGSACTLRSALIHKNTTKPIMITTASRPGKKPTPTEPVVRKVPI